MNKLKIMTQDLFRFTWIPPSISSQILRIGVNKMHNFFFLNCQTITLMLAIYIFTLLHFKNLGEIFLKEF